MAKLTENMRIVFKTLYGRTKTGHITYCRGRSVRIKGVDSRIYRTMIEGKGEKVEYRTIKPEPFSVCVFDTQLDKGWRSRRQSAKFWEQICFQADWDFTYERIHSLEDMRYFLEERKIPARIIIFNGHGTSSDGFRLTNNQVLDRNTAIKIHPDNKHKIIIFSSCLIGANRRLCKSLFELFCAEAVVAYKTEVQDVFAFLVETALLELFDFGYSIETAVETVKKSLDPWKTINLKGAKAFPLVYYTNG